MSALPEDDSISKFFELIVKCPTTVAEKYFHESIDVFCGREGLKYDHYSGAWSLSEWWDLIDASQRFLKRYKATDTEIKDLLSPLPADYQNAISQCLSVRSEDINCALLEKTHEVSPAFLKDFDWKLKLALASDKMAQLNEPRLNLDLDIQKANKTEKLSFDLSEKEVKALIDALTEATKEITPY